MTRYRDKAKTTATEVYEEYNFREDHLVSKSYWPAEGKHVFRYEIGRPDGLRRHTYLEGKRRELLFYVMTGARLDGLSLRVEEVSPKLKVRARLPIDCSCVAVC